MAGLTKKQKHPGGRPSIYTPELVEAFLLRVSSGEATYKICMDEGMPNQDTIYAWIGTKPEFSDKYAKAKADGLEKMADEMLRIADEPVGSTDSGATDSGAVNKQRLQVDTRKWILSKLAPKKYGDKQVVEHTGELTIATALSAARSRLGE